MKVLPFVMHDQKQRSLSLKCTSKSIKQRLSREVFGCCPWVRPMIEDHVDFSLFGLHRKVVSHEGIKVLLREANSDRQLVLAQIDAVRIDHLVHLHGVLHRSKV